MRLEDCDNAVILCQLRVQMMTEALFNHSDAVRTFPYVNKGFHTFV